MSTPSSTGGSSPSGSENVNHASEPRKTKSKSIIVFVCVVIFLDTMGAGLIIPVMPQLLGELTSLVNADMAKISGWLYFTFAIMQFFFAPILGGLSDKYGRRPVLLLALLGYSLDYFVMAVAPTLFFLFVARFLSGLFGATFTAANAAIVDISDQKTRAKYFGMVGAASGIGLIFGPAIGGILGEYGTRLPFIFAGLISLIACVYGYFFFPETLKPENRRPFTLARANPVGSLLAIMARKQSSMLVLSLLGSFFFIYLANQSYIVIWAFFAIEVAGWSSLTIGISVAIYGASQAIVQGFLTGPVVKRVGEQRAAHFSFIIAIITFVLLGFANSGIALIGLILFGALTGFVGPSLQALMTQHTPENAQGELQGANSCLFSITTIAGPILMTQTFSRFSDDTGLYLPGAPFLLAGLLISIALMVFTAGMSRENRT